MANFAQNYKTLGICKVFAWCSFVRDLFLDKNSLVIQLLAIVRLLSRFSILIWCLLLLYSCSERLPEGIVHQEKMTEILFDVHIADGYLSTRPIDSARNEMEGLYAAIFQRHGIDSVMLRSNIEYYARHPAVMKVMYAEIETKMDRILTDEQDAINKQYELKRIADSIRTANTQDSLRRVANLQRDMERTRHLLYLSSADTLFDASVPVTFETLRERLYEEIHFDSGYVNALSGENAASDTTTVSEPAVPAPLNYRPNDISTPRPAPDVDVPATSLTPMKILPEEVN